MIRGENLWFESEDFKVSDEEAKVISVQYTRQQRYFINRPTETLALAQPHLSNLPYNPKRNLTPTCIEILRMDFAENLVKIPPGPLSCRSTCRRGYWPNGDLSRLACDLSLMDEDDGQVVGVEHAHDAESHESDGWYLTKPLLEDIGDTPR